VTITDITVYTSPVSGRISSLSGAGNARTGKQHMSKLSAPVSGIRRSAHRSTTLSPTRGCGSTSRPTPARSYPLRGLLRCSVCNRKMEASPRAHGIYYRCPARTLAPHSPVLDSTRHRLRTRGSHLHPTQPVDRHPLRHQQPRPDGASPSRLANGSLADTHLDQARRRTQHNTNSAGTHTARHRSNDRLNRRHRRSTDPHRTAAPHCALRGPTAPDGLRPPHPAR
jgi:hypothetical protein